MENSTPRQQLAAMAEEMFGLSNLGSRFRARGQRGTAVEALTETEFLALDMLNQQPSMTVGEIQKGIGVLPAQMSRIIRSLEDKSGTAYIECSINSDDRRRIDVTITADGRKALERYRSARMALINGVLGALEPDEREELMRILRKMQAYIVSKLDNGAKR